MKDAGGFKTYVGLSLVHRRKVKCYVAELP